MIARNSNGELLKLSTGVIPNLTPLQSQLWAIHHGMVRAWEDNHSDIIVETDTWEAFNVLKNFPYDVPVEAIEPAIQIFVFTTLVGFAQLFMCSQIGTSSLCI